MIAWIVKAGAALAAKEIPWKWIGVALAVIGVVCVIGFGYLHVENLKKDLVARTEQLAKEQAARQLAEATKNAVIAEHDAQIGRINDLEQQRYDIAVEVTKLRTDLANLDLEQDMESDNDQKADAAIGRLNAANARLDQLLRDASGAKAVLHAGKGAGGKAGKAGSGGYLDRALQALRKDGVRHAP